ncbi:hypothetical protein [Pseudomonas juntendi]|uniref:hypothetical protein n=1 Tax=Pseudomonas juntendi TaxID=2666183 RepID=UPI001F1C1797|nr:hypothetical protein [Pseudomonas juntendi]ELS0925547.1 hypothetical protein [Pseudomonas putida]
MVDSTVLVERLVAQDAEIKRLTAQIDGYKGHAARVEKDNQSLRGSCKALGEDLRKAKSASTAARRALAWFIDQHKPDLCQLPGWLARTLTAVIEHDKRPIERKEVANG